MLPLVRIPAQPSSQDCLAWSSDGELAVAAGEEVHLLIPQDGSPEPWVHLRITVSRFTFEEWPWQEQASFKDMSIGEEQARATVTALTWSPPGLARHRRCVLAILTSNLILSLWAATSNPTDLESWERILIVNTALPSVSRLQQRIRSMAWAPTNPQHVDRQTPFSRKKWGIPLMAVADDSNWLYILRISSPFAGQSFEWDAEVVCHEVFPVPNPLNDRPSLLSLAMNANHFVDCIEFGKWNGNLPVLCRSSGTMHYASVSLREDQPSQVKTEDIWDHVSFRVNLDETSPRDTDMPLKAAVTPVIKGQMVGEKIKFGSDDNIGSHVMLKTWGMASFNNLVAACITLHPAKMVEYRAPFDGSATVLFDAGDENGNAKGMFPWQPRPQVDVAETQRVVLDTILDTILGRNSQESPALNVFDLKVIYAAFCGSLLLNDGERFRRLEAAMEILNLVEHHASISLLAEHNALMSISDVHGVSDRELADVVRQMTRARGHIESSSCAAETALLDLCPFCPDLQGIIPFDNFTEAYCSQGHSFGKLFPLRLTHLYLTTYAARCALTFLPLVEPGTTKRCIKCKRECIDERCYPELQMNLSQPLSLIDIDETVDEHVDNAGEFTGPGKLSPASIIFDKFDTCLYCGGKFCG